MLLSLGSYSVTTILQRGLLQLPEIQRRVKDIKLKTMHLQKMTEEVLTLMHGIASDENRC